MLNIYSIPCFVLLCMSCQVWGIEPVPQPLLTSPGNISILVIVDVHRNNDNNGSCTDPNWENLELAYSMWYSHANSSNGHDDVGIEVYDGCSSVERTLAIVRNRLFSTRISNLTETKVASVVTFVEPAVNDAISGAILMSDAFLVIIGPPFQSRARREQGNGHLSIDLSSRASIEILNGLLGKLDWTYVTTVSDGNQESTGKHRSFLASNNESVCVDESVFNTSTTSFNFSSIKTDGVVLFASDIDDAKSVIGDIPLSVAIVLVANGNQFSSVDFNQNAILLSESFEPMTNLVDFMSGSLLQMPSSRILSDYYTSKYNCSFNQTTSMIACSDTGNIMTYLNGITSTERFHMASKVVDIVTRTVSKASNDKCTVFRAPACFHVTEFDADFETTDMGNLVPKAIFRSSLTLVMEGSIRASQIVQQSEKNLYGSQLDAFNSSLNGMFPPSRCTGWCPACHQDECNADNQFMFGGEFLFTPGDIVIAGMFPLTKHLKVGQDITCSGYSIGGNTDVLVEAFLYAIETFKDRYEDVLQNVTIGSVVFDTCSDIARATQIMMNFETCKYMFSSTRPEVAALKLVPTIVPVYVTYQSLEQQTLSIKNNNKLQINVNEDGNIYKHDSVLFDNSMFNHNAIVDILRKMDWSHVGLITSQNTRMDINMTAFIHLANNNSICIAHDLDISGAYQSVSDTIDEIRQSSTVGVHIIFADKRDVDTFFRVLISKRITRTWIVVESRKNWLDFSSVILPSGSLFLRRSGKINNEFESFIQKEVDNQLVSSASDSWLDEFKTSRDACIGCDLPNRVADIETKLRASDIIRAVDVTVHALDLAHRSSCTNHTGPCRKLYTDGFQHVADKINGVMFDYQGEAIDLTDGYQMESYIILNIQSSRIVEIGKWTRRQLTLEKSQYKAYDSSGDEIKDGRRSVCYNRCVCLKTQNTTTTTKIAINTTVVETLLDPEMGFQDSTAEFNSALWSIIVVIIAGSGAFATLCLMLYIMLKVCAGALVRRYLVLGLMLLVAMIFLFLSVLPFVFTPSEAVCGMRYFGHSVSYALCFAIILTKMTTLRDYKYIGLGGEISRINQLLSVLFITGVQIAVGIEWWVLRTPVLYVETNSTIIGDDSSKQTTHYACDFKRSDFLAYHSFVIFLIVLCCLYSISVRKETKNMKEARLLLITSWFCLAIWIAMVVTITVMDREHLETICSIGILANALTMMVVIYFPKLTAISRLKYEVNDHRKGKENGYKVDTDFVFERPYSLPGTLHSSVTDRSLSFPRSLKAFDSSLSY